MAFRIATVFMSLIFALSIAVQFNDPDPTLWVLLYGVPLGLSVMAFFRMFTPVSGLFAILFVAGFLFLMPWGHLGEVPGYVSTVKMTTPESEYAREGIGLLIAAGWLGYLFKKWLREGDDRQPAAVASA